MLGQRGPPQTGPQFLNQVMEYVGKFGNVIRIFGYDPKIFTNITFKLTYHRLLETMKHGYAIRSGLADPYFYGQEMLDLEERCSDPEEIEEQFLKSL